ncbi:M13-type metalloendopeptidase [Christensenella intestinihominis]|uniref:M13-type metalloendopeptidase n=1 Tax=Christensenella intestinihominis TaxID=1851429 RepID=UPI00082AAFC8|nr:M13-type metalloendopeptidase [Christensenella intestinihominis]
MGKKTMIKLIAAVVAVMLLTACAFQNKDAGRAPAAAGSGTKNGVVTLGQLADYFIKAADDYNPGADRAAVLEGLEESEPATRLKMYVVASRAFGKLPAPEGNAQAIAPPEADLAGVPDWAKEELQNLTDSGVLSASDLGLPEKAEGNEPGDAPPFEDGGDIGNELPFADSGDADRPNDFFSEPEEDGGYQVPEGAVPDVVGAKPGNEPGQAVKTSSGVSGQGALADRSGFEVTDEMEPDIVAPAPEGEPDFPLPGGGETEFSEDEMEPDTGMPLPDDGQEKPGDAPSQDASGAEGPAADGGEEAKGKAGEAHKMDDPVTMKDAEILAARIFAAYGTNLRDDFYTAVNKNELDALKAGGEEVAGGSSSVAANTDKQLHDLILGIVNSGEDYPKGSPEQKIRDLYNNVLDAEKRESAGIEPLREYLDAADAAQSMEELYAAIAQAVGELGNFGNGIFPMIPVTDANDSTKRVMQLMTATPLLTSQEEYDDPENETLKSYRETMVKQLVAAGESEADAQRHADELLRLERELVPSMMGAEEAADLKNAGSYYTPQDLDGLMPQAKPSGLLSAIGLPPDAQMLAYDAGLFEAYAKYFTDENLELFKSMQKMALVSGYCKSLSPGLEESIYGPEQAQSPEEAANEAVQSLLSDELGQMYVAKYFPPESKAEVEKMVGQMIDAFKARVNRLDWMDENTKKEALKKLDSITVLIGYPDEWEFNDAEIKGTQEGGSYFANTAATEVKKWEKMVASLDEPVDPRRFALSAYTVNAAASRNTNTIVFPAGILQAPFYDKNASFEENLAAIGSTIAHEITHMFDDGGAQYDANGNVTDWWSKEDYEHFRELCKKAEAFYDGREAAPGIPTDGKETLSENISDIGGIACGLEILAGMENPDYDAFFRSYARQWTRAANHAALADIAEGDVHAPNNLRTNRVLANFQEFADTYGIGQDDGMYVAPEDRIEIW